MSAISGPSTFSALPSSLAAPLPLQSNQRDKVAQQALNTLKAINDPAAKEAAAREQVESAVSLAKEKLKALRMLGMDDPNAAGQILKRLKSVTQRYSDAQAPLSASLKDMTEPSDTDSPEALVSQAKQIGAQLAEINVQSQAYTLLTSEVQTAAIEAQSIIERAGTTSEKQTGRNRLTSITDSIFDGARAIFAEGNPVSAFHGLNLSV